MERVRTTMVRTIARKIVRQMEKDGDGEGDDDHQDCDHDHDHDDDMVWHVLLLLLR